MQTTTLSSLSFVGLIRELRNEIKSLIKQEIQLAKTELGEKASKFGRNGAFLAAGGVIAFAGAIVFLVGLGWLLAYAFQAAGLPPALATFVGLAVIGLGTIMIGGLFALKAVKVFKQESMKPEKTVDTINHIRQAGGPTPGEPVAPQPEPKKSSDELQHTVAATQNDVGETMSELSRRLTPGYVNQQVRHKISEHPYRSGAIALGSGLAGGFVVMRKILHRAHNGYARRPYQVKDIKNIKKLLE